MGPGFWTDRRKTNVERSIPSMLQQLEEHGVLDNFRRLSGLKAPRKGPLYTDSDVYKWLEAVAYVLQSGDNPGLRKKFDEITEIVLAAQEPSGYLNTYWVEDRAKLRFTEMNRSHELYCLGHLLQGAIARYRADGDRKLLDGGIRFVNYLVENFGPAKRPLLTGHPELEMALVDLYRVTKDKRYLDLAGYLLSGVERERLKLRDSDVKYMFSGKPFTSRMEFEGHAVRAMYACSGAADYYAETGDDAYLHTLDRLWNDLTQSKMYVTGGVGSRSSGEAFGEQYELPNFQAYGESCAAIGNMMFNARMLAIHGEAKYADVIERALYNGINSGMSLDGTLYCYRNPLASTGEKIRNPWYDTTCCPPNLERVFASLPGYMYGTDPSGVYVHLYHSSTMNWRLEDGTALRLKQTTDYPWSGEIKLEVEPAAAREFTLHLRIPEWAKGAAVSVNGSKLRGTVAAGEYYDLKRTWKTGDTVTLSLPMDVQIVYPNPRLSESAGKIAVQRGPLVYCMEQVDNPGGISIFDRYAVLNSQTSTNMFKPVLREDRLGKIWVLEQEGRGYVKPAEGEPLYSYGNPGQRKAVKIPITLIPYYAWANRGESAMEVWIPYQLN
jgi:DUF1680 family protein